MSGQKNRTSGQSIFGLIIKDWNERQIYALECHPSVVEISKDHPRYKSLVTREHMAEMVGKGIVAPSGLIAHGRGEAFDYLLGERTTEEAEAAERAAAAFLLQAERPVITVNGNAAALCAPQLAKLARVVKAKVEVNLFHRTPERVRKIATLLRESGAEEVLGENPDVQLEGIASDRAWCTREGIFGADVVLIPLEDGDRAEALVKAGKTVLAIDLNPLSRTSLAAHVTVVDEITRAIPHIIAHAEELKRRPRERRKITASFDNSQNLQRTKVRICHNLHSG